MWILLPLATNTTTAITDTTPTAPTITSANMLTTISNPKGIS